MNRMFKEAVSFDGAIDNWNVENVVRMSEMFSSASSFNQDLSDWCVRAFQYQPTYQLCIECFLGSYTLPTMGELSARL